MELGELSTHPNITSEFINNHFEKFINIIKNKTSVIDERNHWAIISQNRDITLEFIETHVRNIDFQKLSANKFNIN